MLFGLLYKPSLLYIKFSVFRILHSEDIQYKAKYPSAHFPLEYHKTSLVCLDETY